MNYLKILLKLLNHPNNKDAKIAAIGRILWWKINQLYFHFPVVAPLTNTTKILCYPDNSYGSFVVYARFPEYMELKFVEEYLQPTDNFIDVGAHIGDFSIVAASRILKGTILAFEPTTETVHEFRQNLLLNEMTDRVTILEKAVSNKNGTIHFELESESEINHISAKSSAKTRKVATTKLDTVCAEHQLLFVDLLKVDVEGAEGLVFAGAQSLLSTQKIGVILFEVNPKMKQYSTTTADLCSLLESHGYTLFSVTEKGLKAFSYKSFTLTNTINLVAVSHRAKVQRRVKKFIHDNN